MADGPFKRFAGDLRRGIPGVNRASIQYIDLLAGRVLANAKKRAPVKTGALRRSGRIEKVGKSTRILSFGGKGTGVMYAAAVEFGRFVPRGRQRGSVTTPQPYLRPALLEEMKKSRGEMKKVLAANLNHLNKTYGGRI